MKKEERRTNTYIIVSDNKFWCYTSRKEAENDMEYLPNNCTLFKIKAKYTDEEWFKKSNDEINSIIFKSSDKITEKSA